MTSTSDGGTGEARMVSQRNPRKRTSRRGSNQSSDSYHRRLRYAVNGIVSIGHADTLTILTHATARGTIRISSGLIILATRVRMTIRSEAGTYIIDANWLAVRHTWWVAGILLTIRH